VSQHFLLSAKARTLSLVQVARMSEDEARTVESNGRCNTMAEGLR